MNGTYEIKGSNTFYKVWGILTFVFVGIYGLIELLGLVILGAAAVKGNELSNWLGIYSDAYFSGGCTGRTRTEYEAEDSEDSPKKYQRHSQ